MSDLLRLSKKELRKFIVDACSNYPRGHLNERYYPYEELLDAMKADESLCEKVKGMAISIRDKELKDASIQVLHNLFMLCDGNGLIR